MILKTFRACLFSEFSFRTTHTTKCFLLQQRISDGFRCHLNSLGVLAVFSQTE